VIVRGRLLLTTFSDGVIPLWPSGPLSSREMNHGSNEAGALATASPAWEPLLLKPGFALERKGRFLRVTLHWPHWVLSTSALQGGLQGGLRYLVNHQSCEARDHLERYEFHRRLGIEGYHRAVCAELEIPPGQTAVMGTAANMNYASVITREHGDLEVTAVVTAGVEGNAACAGDPAQWRETESEWAKLNPTSGTINTILLFNRPLTHGALARAAVTMTEAKTAALQRLAVASLYSADLATGTGTDQYCIAAPAEGSPPLTSTSPHVKLGELIGLAVRDATLQALRWQNGLEASYTRGLLHCLRRYGLSESRLYECLAQLLNERQFELFRRNEKSVLYEPLVSAAAYAIASVLDRVRYGTLPAGVAGQALRYQGACLAAAVAAQPDHWMAFYQALPQPDPERPWLLVCTALALGWASKWS